jgi:uncharacterized protein (TIGR02246 family)
MADQVQVRALIEKWVGAVQRYDLDGVVRDHAEDIVMFDVPPPEGGVLGLDAYRSTWPPFFEWLQQGGRFEIDSLHVTCGGDVASAHLLLRCSTLKMLEEHPDKRLRLTIGLQKRDGRWVVTHEHHSFTAQG